MYFFAFALLALAMPAAWGGAVLLLPGLWARSNPARSLSEKDFSLKAAERAGLFITACLIAASAVLLHALIVCDFSVVYVADYTDRHLPLFYRMTAFWAGQSGSLLFWALSVAVCGALFQRSGSYAGLSAATRRWYWLFYLGTMAFFCLLLLTWSNPFLLHAHPPADGNGLNPLLQNPGMILHPPLLFLGYAGFVIPGCLAPAQAFSRGKDAACWIAATRPFLLLGWVLLTAGIVLGGWWAYMELGWGGYWSWDPVENASLLPWLIATAALHTMQVQIRRNKLHGVNVLLTTLTTIAAFFATYLTRSGVVQSVHAFGGGGVALPLLGYVGLALLIAAAAARAAREGDASSLEGPESREGLVVLVSWLFLALAGIILIATLWPVFTELWQTLTGTADPGQTDAGHRHTGAVGLTQDFYNLVCPPLFAALIALLAACPWLGWKGGLRSKAGFAVVAAVFGLSMAGLWFLGYRVPAALLGSAAACAVLAGSLLMIADRRVRADRRVLCACGVHAGIALMTLGIAFSGPYATEAKLVLAKGETAALGPCSVTLKELYTGRKPEYRFLEAVLEVRRDGRLSGVAAPQQRIYFKWGDSPFAEAATLSSPGETFYAALLGLDEQERAVFHLSLHPLVNWLWIGGAIACLFPLFMLRGPKRKDGC